MKRRSFFHLLWGALAVLILNRQPDSLSGGDPNAKTGPVHECVDRPELPCPACTKWTGDALAIQRRTFRRLAS